jgi:hypothetical protein
MTKTTATEIKTVKRSEIFNIIENLKKGSFVGLNYSTRTGKTVNKQKLVEKITDTVIVVGKNYTDFVNNILERQGDDSRSFVAQEKKGFIPVEGTNCFLKAEKTGKIAMKYIVAKNAKPQTELFYNGEKITKQSNPELFTPAQLKPRNYTLGRGEVKVDDKGQFAKFQQLYITNINRLTVNGTAYIFID